jgi:hypothetical protein
MWIRWFGVWSLQLLLRKQLYLFLGSLFIEVVIISWQSWWTDTLSVMTFFTGFILSFLFSFWISRAWVRVNHAFVYHRWFKYLSFSLENTRIYSHYDYFKDKDLIRQQLTSDFLDAFEKAAEKKIKKIKLQTHGFVVTHVLTHPSVMEYYDIQTYKQRPGSIRSDILALLPASIFRLHRFEIQQEIQRKRARFLVILKLQ